MTSLARWYCPPGVPRPPHAISADVFRMVADGGPVGADPGGVCYGGPIEPGETGWIRHDAGHWFDLRGASPLQMIRLDPHPRLIEWRTVAGSLPGHFWRVPVIVSPVYDEADPTRIVSFASSIDRTWDGSGWNVPERIAALRVRLMHTFQEIAGERASLSSAAAVNMALDLLEEGQQFDRSEAIASGWISEVLVVRTLCAGSDRDLG